MEECAATQEELDEDDSEGEKKLLENEVKESGKKCTRKKLKVMLGTFFVLIVF